MMSSEIVTTDESRPNGIGPGDRLQAARIEQNLSIEDVANRLHLSVSILQSIEENNFDDITAPIFVKGYLRAYARIVSLSEEDMIQQYVEFYSGEDPPINKISNTLPDISARDVKWTTYIVILVLFGLLAAWWWNKSQQPGDVVSLDVDQSTISITEQGNDNVAVEKTEIVASSDENIEENSVAAISPDVIEVIEQQAIATDQRDVISNTETEAVVEPTAPIEEPIVTEAEPMDTQSEVSSMEVDSAVIQNAASGSNVIKLIIHADTWADIKDAGGNRLAYDLLRAERELTLTGQPPFTVFFGNGYGVEMTYNNEKVDLSRYIRDDNTARLKLGIN